MLRVNLESSAVSSYHERSHEARVKPPSDIDEGGGGFSRYAEERDEDAVDARVLIDESGHNATLFEAARDSFDPRAVRAPDRVNSVGLPKGS